MKGALSPTDHAGRLDPSPLVTQLLRRMASGDDRAEEELASCLYRELYERARSITTGSPEDSLQATALLHEAWMRVRRGGASGWRDRAHFFATASRAMRQILVDRARARRRLKRDAGRLDMPLDEIVVDFERRSGDLERVDEALEKLATRNAELASLIELRFFGGLSTTEAAAVLGVTLRTLERRWEMARTWLQAELA